MKVYVSGKVSGDSEYRKKFADATAELLKAGYDAVNPVEYASLEDSWNTAMRKTLALLLVCDGVALLHDWKDSRGAGIEARLAADLGLDVRPIDEWLGDGGK